MLLRPRSLPVALVALTAALAAVPGAHAAPAHGARPDLRAAASKPPAAAKPGDTVSVKVTLRNAGRGRAGATTTRLSLGAGRAFAAGDLVLASVRHGALARGRTAKPVTARLRIPLDGRASGARRLLACGDATGKVREGDERNNCTTAGRITFPAVAAESLVAGDLAAGRIDEDQAFALRLLAQAGEPEDLPERYRGAAGTGAGGTAAVTAAAARFATLSPKGQALLAPLFAPPGHTAPPAKGSGKGQAPRAPKAKASALAPPDPRRCLSQYRGQVPDTATWASRLAPTSKVTFWWPKSRRNGAAVAKTLADAMDRTIWPKLTALMGRTPKADDTLDCGHGSTGGLDVYLVDTIGGRPWNAPQDPGDPAVTLPYTCIKGTGNPTFVKVADTRVETLAHEFFHTLQFAFKDRNDCVRKPWIDEGTAEWAVEYAYPGKLKDVNAVWLRDWQGTDLLQRSYDAWPFWYSVTHEAGADTIRALYANTELTTPLDAVDRAIGSFRARFPEFARSAYNQAPVTSYTDWTATTHKPTLVSSLLSLDGASLKTVPYSGSASIDPLVRDYQGFAFEDQIRKITLSGLPADADYKLWALMRMRDGSWQERDATRGLTLCREVPADDVQEITFVASNASPTARVTGDPKLKLEDTCGLPRFRVTAASFSLHTTGEMASDGCGATGISGTDDYGGQLASPVDDPEFRLVRKIDGRLQGDVFFDLPADGTTHLKGCTDPFGDELPCATSRSIRKVTGTDTIGFQIEIEPNRPQTARLRWHVDTADIGYFDADDSVCNVDEFYNYVDLDDELRTVPSEQLRHGTHTFINKGTKAWHIDAKTKKPAEITLGWGYSVTLQVLDQDGNPIP
jgi:hypothetical protein